MLAVSASPSVRSGADPHRCARRPRAVRLGARQSSRWNSGVRTAGGTSRPHLLAVGRGRLHRPAERQAAVPEAAVPVRRRAAPRSTASIRTLHRRRAVGAVRLRGRRLRASAGFRMSAGCPAQIMDRLQLRRSIVASIAFNVADFLARRGHQLREGLADCRRRHGQRVHLAGTRRDEHLLAVPLPPLPPLSAPAARCRTAVPRHDAVTSLAEDGEDGRDAVGGGSVEKLTARGRRRGGRDPRANKSTASATSVHADRKSSPKRRAQRTSASRSSQGGAEQAEEPSTPTPRRPDRHRPDVAGSGRDPRSRNRPRRRSPRADPNGDRPKKHEQDATADRRRVTADTATN